MSEIKVQVIWKNGVFLKACQSTQGLNCALFTNSARIAWLKVNQQYNGTDEKYEITFKDPKSVNAIKGVWVEVAGVGMLLDAALNGVIDVNAVIDNCNGCCGTDATVAGFYNGTYPAFVDPLAKTYTIVRTDDGSMLAQETFMLDYLLMISGSLTKTSYSGTQSTYVFKAYSDPVAIGTDTITETARVFTSNAAPSLTGSNVLNASGIVDGQAYHVKGGTTVTLTVTALNADTITSPMGTWAVAGSTITLTTLIHDYGTIVLGQEAP